MVIFEMDAILKNKVAHSVGESVSQQQSHGEIRQNSKSTPSEVYLVRTSESIDMTDRKSNQPTRLEYAYWSTNPIYTALYVFSLYICISMIIAVLIILLSSSKQSTKMCKRIFKSTIRSKITGYESQPQSLAVGDFNRDHYQDIVVANFGTDNIGIFISMGNGNFKRQKTYETGIRSRPSSVAVGDFNNDNKLDIAVANYGTNSIAILFGYNDGSFSAPVEFSLNSSRPVSITLGHLNNDNKLDIAVVDYGTNNIVILFGDGNSSFTNPTFYSMGYDSIPYSIAVGNFNSDNQTDIIIANYGTDTVGVLFGDSYGSFTKLTFYSTGVGSRPRFVTVGDFNNDYHLDLALVNSGSNTVAIFLSFRNGTFSAIQTYPTGQCCQPMSIAIADFDGDSRLDIIVANNDSNNIGLFRGHGNGSFTLETVFSTGSESSPYSVVVGDFNNDSLVDLATTNHGTNTLGILLGRGIPHFAIQATYSTGRPSAPYWVTVGDLNNDGQLDIVTANRPQKAVGILLGNIDGTFSTVTTYSTGDRSDPYAVAVGDCNNDNRLDILVTSWKTHEVGILLDLGDGSFHTIVMYSTGAGSGPNSVTTGDFNSDGRLDMVVSNENTNAVGVFLGNGDGSFANIKTYSTEPGHGPHSIITADINQDKKLDIVVANTGSNDICILYGNGDGSLGTITHYPTGQGTSPYSVTAGDFNNDTRLDLAYVNRASKSMGVLLAQDDGRFTISKMYATGDGSQPSSIAIGDFNNDRCLDIVLANRDTNNIGVAFGFGDGFFTNVTTFATGDGSYPIWVTTGDFNKDNRADIVVANYGFGNVGVFIETDHYVFSNVITYSTGSSPRPHSLTISDLNNDDQLDIIVANAGNSNIGILLGNNDGTFQKEITYSTGINSRPQHVAIADFNRDNRTDALIADSNNNLVSVLLGFDNETFGMLHSYATGDNSQPNSVAISDFNGDNWLDVVVANTGIDNIGILLGYNHPEFTIVKSFRVGSRPNSLAINDLNNDNQLDIVVANTLHNNIGILLGHGDGTFEKQRTFSTGANSKPNSVGIGDFDNDNHLDIIVANRQSHNIGIFWAYGNGSFEPMVTYSTGNYSSPNSIVIADFNNDDRPDVAVANFNSDNIGVFVTLDNRTLTPMRTYSTNIGSHPCSIAVGDFIGDNQTDIVVATSSDRRIYVFRGYGDGTFELVWTDSIGNKVGFFSIGVGDFNGDNQLDIVISNFGECNMHILLGQNNGSFMRIWTYFDNRRIAPAYVAVGDFNNDQQLDIVTANYGSGTVTIRYGYGNGTFANRKTYSMGVFNGLTFVAVGDFNNDNRLDIAVTNYNNDYIGVILGYSVPFAMHTMYHTGNGSAPYSVNIADFNHDHRSDIVVANSGTNDILVLYGFGNASFTVVDRYSTGIGSNPRCVVIADMNNDNRFDLLVANYGTDNVGIFYGNEDGTFDTMVILFTGQKSHPIWIDFNDLNNDKQLDLVVANSGSNSIEIFHGDGNKHFEKHKSYIMNYNSHPYATVIGDFNNDSWMDIAIANYDGQGVEILMQIC